MKNPLVPNNPESTRLSEKGSLLSPALVLAVVFFLGIFLTAHSPAMAKEPPAVSDPQVITYPVSDFADGKAKFFQFKTPKGKTVRYFVVKSADGVIRSAFDACDVCWPSGKGYYQDKDLMVCKNCGRKFPTNQVNVVTGGCNPSALHRQISKTQVSIQVKDIVAGQHYFNF